MSKEKSLSIVLSAALERADQLEKVANEPIPKPCSVPDNEISYIAALEFSQHLALEAHEIRLACAELDRNYRYV